MNYVITTFYLFARVCCGNIYLLNIAKKDSRRCLIEAYHTRYLEVGFDYVCGCQ